MGLLDQILGGMTGGNVSGQSMRGQSAGGGMGNALVALLPVVLSMLANRQGGGMGGAASGMGGLGGLGGSGGLGSLIEQMTRSGFGQQANSWVGTGANEPLPPDAWSDVLGSDRLGAIAAQAGLSEEQTRTGLSDLMPEVVDRLTPGGQMPAVDQLLSSIDEYERRLHGAETTRG